MLLNRMLQKSLVEARRSIFGLGGCLKAIPDRQSACVCSAGRPSLTDDFKSWNTDGVHAFAETAQCPDRLETLKDGN